MLCGLVHVAEQQREPLELGAVAGKRVGRLAGLQVARVAGPLAEPVRLLEHVGVVGVEQPGGAQAVERVDRARDPQLGMVAAVHELEQLHGELDVRQRARARA